MDVPEEGRNPSVFPQRELREWLGLTRPEDSARETAADVLGTLESAVTGLLAWIGRRSVR